MHKSFTQYNLYIGNNEIAPTKFNNWKIYLLFRNV